VTPPRPVPPAPVDERQLRHPWERRLFVACVVTNIALLVGAVWAIATAPEWLTTHPIMAKPIETLQALATAALLAAPAVILLRRTRWGVTHWNGIRLSPAQIPDLYALLTRQCAVFNMEVPALYVSDTETDIARAYSAWDHIYIVLSDKLLQPDVAAIQDAIAFHIGREVGRIRLGYTEWWDEMLLSYVVQIPILRNPLLHLRAYSADRYAAYLEPHGVRGLLALACGRLMLPRVDVDAYVRAIPDVAGFARLLATYSRRWPPMGRRVRALYDLGLFKSSTSS
jgi:hypothetical protein